MPDVSRLLLLPLLCLVAGCHYWDDRYAATVVPDAPVYCYKTLARVACYPAPQQGLGQFVGTQQPVILQRSTTLEDGSVLVETVSPADAPPVIPMPIHP